MKVREDCVRYFPFLPDIVSDAVCEHAYKAHGSEAARTVVKVQGQNDVVGYFMQ